MNKYISILLFSLLVLGCKQGATTKGGDVKDSVVVDSVPEGSSGYEIDIETLSDKDLWLNSNLTYSDSQLLGKLVDAYNSFLVHNSIMTDFDTQMRFDDMHDSAVVAIKAMDVTKVKDPDVLRKLEDYKNEMLFLLSVDPDNVDKDQHHPWKARGELFDYLAKKYNLNTFGKIDRDTYLSEYEKVPSVPEWNELKHKHGQKGQVKTLLEKYNGTKDFDAKCIYAIELAHAYEADKDAWPSSEDGNPAISCMQSLMKEKKYSLYLFELWVKWRVLYQDTKGASKDSEIPNRIYNNYRNICCCTILSYIKDNPRDIKAINEFLVLASTANIFRHGEWDYGNQYMMDKINLFPEFFDDDE